IGTSIQPFEMTSVSGHVLSVPNPSRIIHLQFRRFAGCPICNLHLQSFIQNHTLLEDQGIQEIVVFHSSRDDIQEYQNEAPFPLIADPNKALYRTFEVGASISA